MSKKDKRPPLLIREQFESVFIRLTDTERGKLLSALMAYRFHGREPGELSERLLGIFETLRAFADDDEVRYVIRCEQATDAAQKRWEKERAKKQANDGI